MFFRKYKKELNELRDERNKWENVRTINEIVDPLAKRIRFHVYVYRT